MNSPISMIMLAFVVLCLLLVNINSNKLLHRSWRREKQALDALDNLSKAFSNYRESHENLMEAHERNSAALQERIDILEGALRERGVNI